MATTAYTDNQVFTTPLANVYCNAIITALEERNKAANVNQVFALTGTAAKIIQGQATEPVKNIAFITSDQVVFDFLSNDIRSILPAIDIIKRKDVLQFKASGFFFEIHLASTTRTINDVSGVFVQDINEIPNFIL